MNQLTNQPTNRPANHPTNQLSNQPTQAHRAPARFLGLLPTLFKLLAAVNEQSGPASGDESLLQVPPPAF